MTPSSFREQPGFTERPGALRVVRYMADGLALIIAVGEHHILLVTAAHGLMEVGPNEWDWMSRTRRL